MIGWKIMAATILLEEPVLRHQAGLGGVLAAAELLKVGEVKVNLRGRFPHLPLPPVFLIFDLLIYFYFI